MKYFRLDLLTLLVSLFTFSACHDSETIGLDINEADKINGALTDTSTVTAVTVPEDTFVANNLQQHAIGYMNNPIFGKTDAGLALSITYPADSSEITFSTGPVIDSVVLVLKYGSEFLRDTSVSGSYTVNVHHLNEIIKDSRTSYYSDKEWGFNSTVIGSKKTSTFRVKDSINVNVVRPGKTDTIQKIPGQLRIPINKDFVLNTIMNPIISGQTGKPDFSSAFKGFYITMEKTQSTATEGVVFIDAVNSRFELYYTRSTGTKQQKSVIYFPAQNAVSSVKHDYSHSGVEVNLNKPNTSAVYLQALAGVRAQVSFPYLSQLKNLGNISVNKAQLILSVDPDTKNLFGDPSRLVLYTTDIAGQRQEVPDNDWGQISGLGQAFTDYGGTYDQTKKTYTFNITSYIQGIVSGRLIQYNSYIAPVKADIGKTRRSNNGSSLSDLNPRIIDAYPSGATAGRLILGGGTKSSSKARMKLVITYTKLSQ